MCVCVCVWMYVGMCGYMYGCVQTGGGRVCGGYGYVCGCVWAWVYVVSMVYVVCVRVWVCVCVCLGVWVSKNSGAILIASNNYLHKILEYS